jgi:serine/threonine protein phosphatase 1
MIASFRQLFSAREATKAASTPVGTPLGPSWAPPPRVPPGQRVYAVGDIHGRADLLAALIDAIEADDAARRVAATTIVLLGDLIDRGPDSAVVLALAQEWQRNRRLRVLCGNHEEMLLESLVDLDTLRNFLRYGGRETVLSFGIDADKYDAATYEELQALMANRIPEAVIAFIRSFEEQVRIGDYLFVHAGIRPGIACELQQRSDLLWIREPFLSYAGDLGLTVVHGHTICERPDMQSHRIGIDTGAYLTGNLTAIGLEGSERWLIVASAGNTGITTSVTSCSLKENS